MVARIEAEIPGLRRFLTSRALPGDEVEDVLQDALARALRYRGSFDPAGSLGGWLRTTALRVSLDHRARRARGPLALGEAAEELAEPTPLEAPDADEVRRLLLRLRPIEREVLVRFHQHGESVEQIARALARPVGTVKSDLHRARRRLAEPAPEERR